MAFTQTSTGFGSVPTIGSGQTYPTASEGNSGINPRNTFAPNPTPDASYSNSFLPANMTANLFNLSGVAGNLGTMMGQTAPQAASFINDTFNPNLNTMEQSFAQASMQDALRAMNQQTLRAEGQFENSPFHSSLPQVQREILSDTTNNLAKNFSQMGLQRQQIGAGLAQFPFQFPLQAADVGAQAAERTFNMANQAMNANLQFPLSIYNQIPTPGPVIATGGGQQGGGGKLG